LTVEAPASVEQAVRLRQMPVAAKRHGRGWLMRRLLVLADVLGLIVAFAVTELLYGSRGTPDAISLPNELMLFLATIPVWLLGAKLAGLYDRDEARADHSTADELVRVFLLATAGMFLITRVTLVPRIADPDIVKLTVFWALLIVCIPAARIAIRAAARRSSAYVQQTVIVGAWKTGQLVARKMLQHPEYGINLLGFVDTEPSYQRPELAHLTILGGPADLPDLVERLGVERAIVAFSSDADGDLVELMRTLNALGVQIDIVPRFYDVLGPQADVHSLGGLALVGLPPLRLTRWSRFLKRGMDVIGAVVGLLVLAPLLGFIALLVKLDSRGPVLFRQMRVGSGERPFEILKFRTMVIDAEDRKPDVAHLNMHMKDGGDPRMFKVRDDPRVTRLGRFLRRWSLDELPQLINVVKGEMSLVGPRPLILSEHQCVEAWAKKRLDLRPGITGLWQVVGRSDVPFEEMVHLDYRYVIGWSLMTDIKIVLRTIPTLFRERPAY
jgi:exopolysaccharide biosynthesis polyprenyl glycosylphosphotransferase